MKQITQMLTLFLLFLGITAFSQNATDFIIIDEIAGNYQELVKQFEGQNNVYATEGIKKNAIEQISEEIKNSNSENLYIYVPTKPGAIVFSSIAITTQNVDEFTEELKKWKNNISMQVIINSSVVFNGEDGTLLKQRLERITGLVFTTHK